MGGLSEKNNSTTFHFLFIGLFIDQLVRRIDPKHRSLQQFFHEEIAQLFGEFTI